jgi:DNA-binding CsgD family transcriptional regulator
MKYGDDVRYPEIMICRDDLRYTDDVIATLRSANTTWYIAKALNIPEEDVLYHMQETFGMSHNGTVIRITETEFFGYAQLRDRRNCKSNVLPLNHDYYESRTVKQICNEYNLSDSTVRNFVRQYGFKTKRAIRPSTYYNRWPSDAAWYAEKTTKEIADALHVTNSTVKMHCRKHGLKWKRIYTHIKWPADASYYAAKTTAQIAKDLGTSLDSVRYHCKRHGYTHIPYRKEMGWPSDPEWFATRTRKQISAELGIVYNTVRMRIWRMNIICLPEEEV